MPSTHIPLTNEDVFEYILKHSDEVRKDVEKNFIYVGENYIYFKDYINNQMTGIMIQVVAKGLGCSYEDVAMIMDYETLKNLVGEEWFKF